MAQYPVITAGARITADLLSSMIPNYVIKTADTVRASVITSAADPDLVTGTLAAGGVYHVYFHVRFSGLQPAGLRTAWIVPSGTTGNRGVMGPAHINAINATDAVVESMRWAIHAFGTNVPWTNPRNSTANQTWLIEEAIVTIGATAGTISLGWGQNVSNATGSIIFANSFVRWQQVG